MAKKVKYLVDDVPFRVIKRDLIEEIRERFGVSERMANKLLVTSLNNVDVTEAIMDFIALVIEISEEESGRGE